MRLWDVTSVIKNLKLSLVNLPITVGLIGKTGRREQWKSTMKMLIRLHKKLQN